VAKTLANIDSLNQRENKKYHWYYSSFALKSPHHPIGGVAGQRIFF